MTQPCEVCTLHDHNGHYWLFLAAAVAAAKRCAARRGEAGDDEAGGGAEGGGTVLRWSELAYNGVEVGPAAAGKDR